MKRLAIVSTHPIQYYAPIFQLLCQRNEIEICVFYTWGAGSVNKHDPGFGKPITWDLPLVDGYPFEWALNSSSDPGSHHFTGIKNPGIIEQLTNWQPDAILIFGWAYHSHLKLIRHFSKKLPLFFRGDSTLLDPTASLKSLLKPMFLNWVYRHIDVAFYVGAENKAYFRKYGLQEHQLVFAPHAVDNDRFGQDRSAEAKILRNKLGVGPDEILLLFAGKLGQKKDPLILLKAFQQLANPNIHLLFAGNGEMEQKLKRESLIDSITGRKQIHFIDFQNQTQMPVLYQSCDLFCLTSVGPETWGLAVSEAMACGKAVLVTDRAGCKADLVKPGGNGFIFKSGDLEDLKGKLEYLTSDRERLARYGKLSKSIIKDWNFLHIAEAIEKQVNAS